MAGDARYPVTLGGGVEGPALAVVGHPHGAERALLPWPCIGKAKRPPPSG